MSKYSKFLVAAGAAISVAIAAISDDHVDANDAIQVVLAALASLGVYVVPNSD
jgi:hypothetical protein